MKSLISIKIGTQSSTPFASLLYCEVGPRWPSGKPEGSNSNGDVGVKSYVWSPPADVVWKFGEGARVSSSSSLYALKCGLFSKTGDSPIARVIRFVLYRMSGEGGLSEFCI
ncbi:hypothetical protein AVEN_258006-1 [Araneus ventricosus]|uniref:Uncharacterized protein n=1 Tax=Araneus ventricosus TaxID=182803 RepID=A0A4Y2Q1P8_ARAVE|nr:hypothetical protein AVEN_258006-1 [Araneus ventricosus]